MVADSIYIYFRKRKPIYSDSNSVQRLQSGTKKHLVMKIFCTFISAVILQVYTHVKMHQIAHFSQEFLYLLPSFWDLEEKDETDHTSHM